MSKQIDRSQNKLALAILVSLFCCFLSFANQANAHTEVQIRRVENIALFGNYQHVTVNLTNNTNQNGFSSFSLLINYDTTYFSYLSTQADSLIIESGWETFTATLEQPGFIRITAKADADGVAPFPSSHLANQVGSLCQMTFKVTNNIAHTDESSLIQFYWQECDDNHFLSRNEDSLLLVDSVYLYASQPAEPVPGSLFTNQGIPDSCLSVSYPGMQPVRDVIFKSRVIDLQNDWYLPTGDINLNHIINEPADRDILGNYLMVISINWPTLTPEQSAASDANRNGIAAEILDLVFMQRIINGDTVPVYTETPLEVPYVNSPDTAIYTLDVPHKTISVSYPDRLACVFLILQGVTTVPTMLFSDSAVIYSSIDQVNMRTHLTILPDKSNAIASGPLLQYTGNGQIASATAIDYHQRIVLGRLVITGVAAGCGDVNVSGSVNIQDIIYMVQFMFNGGPQPLGTRNGDVSCDNMLNILDLISMVNYFFNGSSTPCCLGQ